MENKSLLHFSCVLSLTNKLLSKLYTDSCQRLTSFYSEHFLQVRVLKRWNMADWQQCGPLSGQRIFLVARFSWMTPVVGRHGWLLVPSVLINGDGVGSWIQGTELWNRITWSEGLQLREFPKLLWRTSEDVVCREGLNKSVLTTWDIMAYTCDLSTWKAEVEGKL